MYKIYCHIFPNGKRYIGQTKQTLEGRFKDGKGYTHSPMIYNAIQKYGWENVEHILLEEGLTAEMAAEREKYYIALYKTNEKEYGYNLTYGGEGNTRYDYSYIVSLWEKGASYKDIMSELGCGRDTIQNALDGAGIKGIDRIKSRAGQYHSQKVYQYDLKTNVLLNSFPSLSEAERMTGVSHGNISRVLKGERKTAGGFLWTTKEL